MSAATLGVGLAVIATVSRGPEDLSVGLVAQLTGSDIVFRSQNFGRDRLEALQHGPMERLSETRVTVLWERFSDPAQRTDAQVRNAHRTWSRRANNPSYDQPDRARDMTRILDNALDYRGLEPHNNI
ncbi:MAG: hypothetical protein AAF376_08180 [Pseudomonadota bacterium]